MNKLIFMRGVSGSGKSTLAHKVALDYTPSVILSTDELWHEWVNINRAYIDHKYLWNASAIGAAHQVNQAKAKVAMDIGIRYIIIDNTNTTFPEIEAYLKHVDPSKYEVVLLEPSTEWKHDYVILTQKNVHDVPEEIIKKQLGRYVSNRCVIEAINRNFPTIIVGETI